MSLDIFGPIKSVLTSWQQIKLEAEDTMHALKFNKGFNGNIKLLQQQDQKIFMHQFQYQVKRNHCY